ncbi:unnamed protein product [Closterium sp. Yama58-4]|nr:unnamed protein product [Closterium sp. Yama58-4]
MRDDIVQAVTAVTQQALGTVGFSLPPNVLATMRPGRLGTSPSAGDQETAPRQRPEKRAGSGSAADDDNAGNSKRSKGVDGNRAVGGDVPDRAQTGSPVLDMLKKKGATIRLLAPQSRGGAGGSSEGRTAAPAGLPLTTVEGKADGATPDVQPGTDAGIGNVGGSVGAVGVQADAALPTIHTATGTSTNAVLLPIVIPRGPVFEVQAPSIGVQTQMVGVGENTGAIGAEDDTGGLGVEDDPVARALMEELLALQAPSQQQPVATDNSAVPTTRGGSQPVAGTAPTAPISADNNARHAAAPSTNRPTTVPVAAPTTGQDNAGHTPSDPVAVLAAVNARQVAAPSSHPPTSVASAAPTTQLPGAVATPSDPVSDMLMAEVFSLQAAAQSAQPQTHGQRAALTTVNLGEPVHQEAPNETVPAHHQVGAASGQGDWGAVAGDDGAGEIPLVIEDADVELLQAALEADDLAALQPVGHPRRGGSACRCYNVHPASTQAGKTVQSARLAGVSVAGQPGPSIPAFQTGATSVTGADQAGLAGPFARPTAVPVATQASQAGPSARSAGVTVADPASQAGTSTVLAGGPVGVHADKDGQSERGVGGGEGDAEGYVDGDVVLRRHDVSCTKVLADFKQKKSSGPPLMKVLRPAVWFGPVWDPAKRKQQLSDIINRASLCAAFGPVAADAVPKTGAGTSRLGQAVAASSCAVWCFAETVAEVGKAAGEAKAAALLCKASTDFADTCHDVVIAVLATAVAVARQPVLGEVPCNVTDTLQRDALRKAYKGGDPTPDAEIIARATIETLAF